MYRERKLGMAQQPPATQLLPHFTYDGLVQGEAEQRQLKVHGMQQVLRRAAALLDYLDDVTLPIPVVGEVVDVIIASPILVAGLLGAVEQLGRRNLRGAVVEVVGSLAEAAVTALPGVEALDLLTGPIQQKRTATMAREWAENLVAGDTPRPGWWTTREGQAYYIQPHGAGYIVNHYGRADNVSPTPLVRVRLDSGDRQAVWPP